eukprot:4736319-Amphidinium_carterae.2
MHPRANLCVQFNCVLFRDGVCALEGGGVSLSQLCIGLCSLPATCTLRPLLALSDQRVAGAPDLALDLQAGSLLSPLKALPARSLALHLTHRLFKQPQKKALKHVLQHVFTSILSREHIQLQCTQRFPSAPLQPGKSAALHAEQSSAARPVQRAGSLLVACLDLVRSMKGGHDRTSR